MSASTHEAVLGGARWRLTLHPDGRWDVAGKNHRTTDWEDIFSGNGGLDGLRWASRDQHALGDWLHKVSGSALAALADVAERSTTL